jgi:hypothetical protein
MAIAMYFHPESMSADTYDEVMRRLDAAGAGSPAGRLHHSAFGPPEALMVYDVWESAEAFDAFAATLGPILEELGVRTGEPDVMPLHNIVG